MVGGPILKQRKLQEALPIDTSKYKVCGDKHKGGKGLHNQEKSYSQIRIQEEGFT